MARSPSSGTVVVDTSVLINLIHVRRLHLLGSLRGCEFIAPRQVMEQVTDPPRAQALAAALAQGHLRREPITDPAELAAYADLRQIMENGEAACLAIAQARGWVVSSDEGGRFVHHARQRLGEGRILNTPGILLLAIQQGLLSIDEADDLKEMLERRRFKMKFGSLRDLLEEPLKSRDNRWPSNPSPRA